MGVTGREGVGGVGVGVGEGGVLGFSDPFGGVGLVGAVGITVGSSEGSSEGEGLGDSSRSPKMLVGPPRVGVLKSLYSRPSWMGIMSFLQIWAAGLPETYIRAGVS